MHGSSRKSSDIPGFRHLLKQAPLTIENLPSRAMRVLPAQIMGMNSGGQCQGQGQGGKANCAPQCCMPPRPCCMPPPMMAPPMCTPYPPPMCYPPPCPPVFCCTQPQPYYCPYPCMPPPNCCPPPPCPPPPCCDTGGGGTFGGKNATGCCGAGKTLVRLPKGRMQNAGCGGASGGGGMGGSPFDQPAAYNNCNFYVTDMPKGFPNNRGGMGSMNDGDECCSNSEGQGQRRSSQLGDDLCDPYPLNGKNYPAGDGKVVPPPMGYPGSQRVPWGNDNEPVASSLQEIKRGNALNAGSERHAASQTAKNFRDSSSSPYTTTTTTTTDRGSGGGYKFKNTGTVPSTSHFLQTAASQAGLGPQNIAVAGSHHGINAAPSRSNQNMAHAGSHHGINAAPSYSHQHIFSPPDSHAAGSRHGGIAAPSGSHLGFTPVRNDPSHHAQVSSNASRSHTGLPTVHQSHHGNNNLGDDDDDGRGLTGRGVRTVGGWMGGPAKENDVAGYCVPQDHAQGITCQEVRWRRKKACCMPKKGRKLATLCQRCHERYSPEPYHPDEHCGLPMPTPPSAKYGGRGGGAGGGAGGFNGGRGGYDIQDNQGTSHHDANHTHHDTQHGHNAPTVVVTINPEHSHQNPSNHHINHGPPQKAYSHHDTHHGPPVHEVPSVTVSIVPSSHNGHHDVYHNDPHHSPSHHDPHHSPSHHDPHHSPSHHDPHHSPSHHDPHHSPSHHDPHHSPSHHQDTHHYTLHPDAPNNNASMTIIVGSPSSRGFEVQQSHHAFKPVHDTPSHHGQHHDHHSNDQDHKRHHGSDDDDHHRHHGPTDHGHQGSHDRGHQEHHDPDPHHVHQTHHGDNEHHDHHTHHDHDPAKDDHHTHHDHAKDDHHTHHDTNHNHDHGQLDASSESDSSSNDSDSDSDDLVVAKHNVTATTVPKSQKHPPSDSDSNSDSSSSETIIKRTDKVPHHLESDSESSSSSSSDEVIEKHTHKTVTSTPKKNDSSSGSYSSSEEEVVQKKVQKKQVVGIVLQQTQPYFPLTTLNAAVLNEENCHTNQHGHEHANCHDCHRRRDNPCCVSQKTKKMKTLCHKCHERCRQKAGEHCEVPRSSTVDRGTGGGCIDDGHGHGHHHSYGHGHNTKVDQASSVIEIDVYAKDEQYGTDAPSVSVIVGDTNAGGHHDSHLNYSHHDIECIDSHHSLYTPSVHPSASTTVSIIPSQHGPSHGPSVYDVTVDIASSSHRDLSHQQSQHNSHGPANLNLHNSNQYPPHHSHSHTVVQSEDINYQDAEVPVVELFHPRYNESQHHHQQIQQHPQNQNFQGGHPRNDPTNSTHKQPPNYTPDNPNPDLTNGQWYYDANAPVPPPDCDNPCPKAPCIPLRPCKSPRLVTCRGQKPIFSVMPPSCPIRETLASILAKKPPVSCKWHEQHVPLYHDYCMPSVKFVDPGRQRITFVDHCPRDGGNPVPQPPKAGPSSNNQKGRGVKRRLNQR